MPSRFIAFLFVFSTAIAGVSPVLCFAEGPGRTPVIVDTDIGDDIDDAFALAMVIQCHQLELRAVTTVTGDTQARARIAAKMLWEAKLLNVPVAAGVQSDKASTPQERWASEFTSPALTSDGAVALLHSELQKSSGGLVVIALGPLTNIAALIQQHPKDKSKIQEVVLMGGSIARGYTPGSGPTPEYNIAADSASAQTVFRSGIPLRMAPLDVTARLQLEKEARDQIFAQHSPLTDSLSALYSLWGQPTPTLHDAMAVALLIKPGLCEMKRLHVDVQQDGMTHVAAGLPVNAVVAAETDPAVFVRYYVSLFSSGSR